MNIRRGQRRVSATSSLFPQVDWFGRAMGNRLVPVYTKSVLYSSIARGPIWLVQPLLVGFNWAGNSEFYISTARRHLLMLKKPFRYQPTNEHMCLLAYWENAFSVASINRVQCVQTFNKL